MTTDQREILRRDCEQLCRAVAPVDLVERPLYILLTSDLPENTLHHDTGGCTDNHLDLAFQSQLGSEWRGRGPALAIDDLSISAAADALHDRFEPFGVHLPPEQKHAAIRADIIAVTVHELAHVLEKGWEYHPLHPTVAPVAAEASKRAIAADPISLPGRPSPDQILHHGIGFIRAAVHCVIRAQATGQPLHGPSVFDPALYRLTFPYEAYQRVIAPEAAASAGKSFKAILATPPPAALVALFNEDQDERQHLQQETAA